MGRVLFKCNGQEITEGSIISALSEVGIQQGDDLMVHSDIGKIGKLADIKDINELGNIIIDLMIKAVSPGTLIFPTFTYSFCKKKEYDPQKSLSTIGALSNIFWQRQDSVRSLHPIFSVASIGKKAKYYTMVDYRTCFGEGTFFDRLVKSHAKVMGFGVKLVSALALLHHIEKMNNVPYRYMKYFEGEIKVGDSTRKEVFEYFVRNLDMDTKFRLDKIEASLREHGTLNSIPLGRSRIDLVEASKVFAILSEELRKDPFFLISD